MGAASSSQAMAPRNGGVTNEAITRMRTVRRSGMSVRATSQPMGAATRQQTTLTDAAMVSVVSSGSTKAGSVNERAEVGERDGARAVGEGEHDEPADRQHDQQAQQPPRTAPSRRPRVEARATRRDVAQCRDGPARLRLSSRAARDFRPSGHDRATLRESGSACCASGRDATACAIAPRLTSHLEVLRVARLDVVGLLLHRGGVVLHQLDLAAAACGRPCP